MRPVYHHAKTSKPSGPWPLIHRELRSEARNRFNFALRWIGAGTLTVLTATLLSHDNVPSASLSLRLFTGSHALLLFAICWVAPILTSDAIGRERREGTLGLLFSTMLSAPAVVIGKGVVHMVRLLTLWLATLPILLVPVLFGGVTWLDVLSAVVIEFSAALCGLAAGLAVSSSVRHPAFALLGAELLAAGVMLGLTSFVGLACMFQLDPFLSGSVPPLTRYELIWKPIEMLGGVFPEGGWSGKLRPAGAVGTAVWCAILAQTLLISGLGFFLLTRFATWRAGTAWMDRPPSARQQRRREFWLVPRFWVRQFLAFRRRGLERNPLGWLHRYSTWSRAASLGAVAAVVLGESAIAASAQPWLYFDLVQVWLSILLSLQMTMAAVMMFRSERGSGVLELLLVTPIGVHQVIYRQVLGFWRRFYLPVLLVLALAQLMVWLDWATPGFFHWRSFLLLNFFTIPLIGLYASARFNSVVGAFVFASFFSLGLPLLTPELSPGLLERIGTFDLWVLSPFPSPPLDNYEFLDKLVKLAQFAAAAIFGRAFFHHLSERTFVVLRSRM